MNADCADIHKSKDPIAFHFLPVLLSLLFSMPLAEADTSVPGKVDLEKQWGKETLDQISQEFLNKGTGLYSESCSSGKKGGAAFMWGCGVQLSALISAAREDPSYLEEASAYADQLDRYWIVSKGLGGFNPATGNINSSSDRYYDDNEWIIIDLTDLYQLTNKAAYLYKAQKTMEFVLSGESDKLGGGIFWHEPKQESKNTCSNAPAIVSLLRLYDLTHNQADLDAALRLYTWINATLQDPSDGLYYDNINIDGRVAKFKLTYNTALMIRANCLLYKVSGKDSYLTEAKRLGNSSIRKWVDSRTGVVKNPGRFSHLLLDAFIELNSVDSGNSLWLNTVDECVSYVHDHLKDTNGHYPQTWDHLLPPKPLNKWALIDQASAARAYWAAAGAVRK